MLFNRLKTHRTAPHLFLRQIWINNLTKWLKLSYRHKFTAKIKSLSRSLSNKTSKLGSLLAKEDRVIIVETIHLKQQFQRQVWRLKVLVKEVRILSSNKLQSWILVSIQLYLSQRIYLMCHQCQRRSLKTKLTTSLKTIKEKSKKLKNLRTI